MVVDRDKQMGKFYTRIFAAEGWATVFTSSGKRALEILLDGQVDLIVTAMDVEEINGPHLLAVLQQLSSRPPILVLSGADNLADLVAPYQDIIYGAYSKPLEPRRLLEVIKSALLLHEQCVN